MSSSCSSFVRRTLKRGLGGALVTTGGILAVPKETLPPSVLQYRVTCEGVGRLIRCGVVGATIAYEYKTASVTDASPQAEWDVLHERAATRLVELAMVNGALYVKNGQGFAQMNHLLPAVYCRVMRRLEDAVLFRPASEIRTVLERELGKPVEEAFDTFDWTPIAAASLAQVHVATVKETKERVAVKVQYLDVADRFNGDMATISLCLRVAGVLFPGYDFGPIMRRSDTVLRAELDFEAEAANSERCGREMAAAFGDRVVTPAVVWPLTTSRLLVTEFIDGGVVKANDREGMRRLGISVKDAATVFVSAMAHQIFNTGFVHGDPHPGNVFVRRHPTQLGKRAQVVLLDHGLYTELTPADTAWFADAFTASVQRDDDGLKRACRAFNISEECFEVLAQMMLMFPYRSFSLFRTRATPEELDQMRHKAAREMHKFTEMIEAWPMPYAVVLRNMNAVRSITKSLQSPVPRASVMLRFSLPRSTAGRSMPVYGLWWALLKVRLLEWYQEWLLAFARWVDPEAMRMADDLMALG